jgi:TPP-dependent pyruvate/acetoin dehydrogenase alpha subunit
MKLDLWSLYGQMLKSRLFEEAVAQLWRQGHISGEMHLGMGEEAIVAGVVSQLQEGDAMALDHRGTPPLLLRGVDPVLLLCEFLGRPDGLCGGMGGHMHLFSPPHLAASSGIVGASGPAAAGFALAAQHLRPGTVAVAFFGEGAMNQGMLLEALNLSVVWNLPVLFVCKDDGWAITTRASAVAGGNPAGRARAFGMRALGVDGSDVKAVWAAAQEALRCARAGDGPVFLHARCVHLEGHFLGDPLLRVARRPLGQISQMAGSLLKSTFARKGVSKRERASNVKTVLSMIATSTQERSSEQDDPLARTRRELETDGARLGQLEAALAQEIQAALETALSKHERHKGANGANGRNSL